MDKNFGQNAGVAIVFIAFGLVAWGCIFSWRLEHKKADIVFQDAVAQPVTGVMLPSDSAAEGGSKIVVMPQVEEPEPVPEKPEIWLGSCYMGDASAVWVGRGRDFDENNTDSYKKFFDINQGKEVVINGPVVCVWRKE